MNRLAYKCALLLGCLTLSACSPRPQPKPGATPASSSDASEFLNSAINACSTIMRCLPVERARDNDRVMRASRSLPEFGNICLHESKITARLRPAGKECLHAAADYLDCRAKEGCNDTANEVCADTQIAMRNECGDFLK